MKRRNLLRTLPCTILLALALPGSAQQGVQQAQERLRLANAAYEAADYAAQVTHLEAALELNPASLRTLYNLACGYALLGEKARALEKLEQLIDLGVDHGLAGDPDLESLQSDPAFKALLVRAAGKTSPAANNRRVATIEELGLIPEGIAHDSASGRTFFGSMRNGGIYVLDKAGRVSRFATIGVPGFSAIGLAVDERRQTLWVIGTATEFAATDAATSRQHMRTPTKNPAPAEEDGQQTGTSTVPEDGRIGAPTFLGGRKTGTATVSGVPDDVATEEGTAETGTATKGSGTTETGTATKGATDGADAETGTPTEEVAAAGIGRPGAPASRTGVFGFDLSSGIASVRFLADPSVEGFNDVTVAPSGNLYVSGSHLRVVSPEDGEVRPLVTSPELFGTNGIAVSPDGTIFTSVYPVGIATVDPASGQARFLELPEDTTLYGVDGLYFHEGDLVAIQNGIEPWRLIRIELDERRHSVIQVRILERANPHVTATTGAIVGDEILYIGQGPAPDRVPTHVPEALVPFFGRTLIMAAPLD